jgi:hypothetical protein
MIVSIFVVLLLYYMFDEIIYLFIYITFTVVNQFKV